jgi:hypothetical protein
MGSAANGGEGFKKLRNASTNFPWKPLSGKDYISVYFSDPGP